MIYKITRKEWDAIPEGYRGKAIFDHEHGGKVCKAGEKTVFGSFIPGSPWRGAVLCFEHIHFEIV